MTLGNPENPTESGFNSPSPGSLLILIFPFYADFPAFLFSFCLFFDGFLIFSVLWIFLRYADINVISRDLNGISWDRHVISWD